MYDLLIVNGTVVSEHDALPLDVAVREERVVALVSRGQIPGGQARRVIDAQDHFVLPGGVDAHVHFDMAISDVMRAQSPSTGSRAGVFGGTTTYVDFSLAEGSEDLLGSIAAKKKTTIEARPSADYGLHAILRGDWPLSDAEKMPEAISQGVVSFKFFTTFRGSPSVGGMMTDDGRIYSAMKQAATHGGIVMVHCEDECIIDFHTRTLCHEEHTEFWRVGDARPPLAEEAAVRRMLLLARRTGSPLYIVHISTREALEAVAEAQQDGVAVAAEALHANLAFGPELYRQPAGQRYMNFPPNRPSEHREALWAAVVDGAVDTVASDDFTFPLANKLSGDTILDVTGGTNSVETRMPYLWSEGVGRRGMSVSRFVQLTAANPARRFGLYGRKGVLRPGADADIVIMDPERTHVYDQATNLHSDCDYSNWDGLRLRGFPRMTVLRGEVLVEDGEWVGSEGAGRFVPGSIPDMRR